MSPTVLILAGQREGVLDPLCEAASVSHKADAVIAGQKMLAYVTTALSAANMKTPFYVSGYKPESNDLYEVPSGSGPADSVRLALDAIDRFPCLVTTCDHPLLTAEMVKVFIAGAQTAGTDICVGLASQTVIQHAYPETKRTYLRFSDNAVSGCNLFWIANAEGLKAIDFWRDVQHLRKSPFKLARKVGISVGVKYAAGRLSLSGAFAYAAERIGITAAPVLLPFAEAAIDVDKPSDLALVEDILRRRT